MNDSENLKAAKDLGLFKESVEAGVSSCSGPRAPAGPPDCYAYHRDTWIYLRQAASLLRDFATNPEIANYDSRLCWACGAVKENPNACDEKCLLKRARLVLLAVETDGECPGGEKGGEEVKDKIEGHLEVGTNDSGEVIVNHPALKPDENGVGHIVFSPRQARHLAGLLRKHADEAEKTTGGEE